MMAKDFLAVQVHDGYMLAVSVEPFLLALGGDIHGFQIKRNLNADALDDVQGTSAKRTVRLCEKGNPVHGCGMIRALVAFPDATSSSASFACDRA